jgi:DNA-binding transcriptional ArsR family regulator
MVPLTFTLRVLSDPNRMRILFLLADGGRDVAAICSMLKVLQPTASHHLGVLRKAGLVKSLVRGQHRIYSLTNSVYGDPSALSVESDNYVIEISAKRDSTTAG